jgi:hypothetical protein
VHYPVEKACVRKLETGAYPGYSASSCKISNPNFAEKNGNFPDISKGISQLGMCKFEPSQVSQAVGRPEW